MRQRQTCSLRGPSSEAANRRRPHRTAPGKQGRNIMVVLTSACPRRSERSEPRTLSGLNGSALCPQGHVTDPRGAPSRTTEG